LLVAICGAVAFLLGMTRAARADAGAARLVLIVANNRGEGLGRAELHYADDDGAKYRALFRGAASLPSDVQLLTRFDRDTSRLFTEAPDGPPTRVLLEQKVAALVARRAELRREGRDVELFFVYAGHGDIDRGKGFIQLEDGTFTADDLAALVNKIDATRAHVLLDSCNSLFLVSPRKPGGLHVATSDDAVRALHERMPRVGVFLSTSADGEVFEWSELGAGIFSHAVLSGLSGAADADGNGEVSYAELRAFVDVATQEVKNPRYRPKVFARGPGGDDRAALFAPRMARGRRILLEGPVRTTLRDADDIPWIDANVESGARVEILLPPALDEGRGTKETIDMTGGAPRVTRRESLDAEATERSEPVAARGPSEIFRSLFVRPFGPRAFAAEAPANDFGAQVYGLSTDDVTRFSTLLAEVADTERSRRHLYGLALVGQAAIYGGMSAVLLTKPRDDTAHGIGVGYAGSAIGSLAVAPWVAFRKGPGEELQIAFERDRARDPRGAVATAEVKLFALAHRERTYRIVGGVVVGGLVAGTGVLFALNELRDEPDLETRGVLTTSLLVSTLIWAVVLQPSPIERLADVWRAEPSRPQVSFAPVGPAGLGGTLSGRF
jgi:hypothetical protein